MTTVGRRPVVGGSAALYSALAPTYEAHFTVAHRRAYDDLAWELVQPLLPRSPGRIVDVGCGVGRWARRLIDLGHTVVGIEPAQGMAAAARHRVRSPRFELIEQPAEEVRLVAGQADLVVAMGSLQYSPDPEKTLRRLAGWARPGGSVAVLVDSLVALVLELLAAGKEDEALLRLQTRLGTWIQDGLSADHHLFDAAGLRHALGWAGLVDVDVRGLLVGWSGLGRERLMQRLDGDRDGQLVLERRLAADPSLADVGKQLFGCGSRCRAADSGGEPPAVAEDLDDRRGADAAGDRS